MTFSYLRGFVATTLLVTLVMLAAAGIARANPRNTLQPANVYFGHVPRGDHPSRVVTVANHTGISERITRFLVSGAGGEKFTLVRHKGSYTSTCRLGMILRNGDTCTIIVRVKTTRPEYWQSVIDVFYDPVSSLSSASASVPVGGVWNGAVYADVV